MRALVIGTVAFLVLSCTTSDPEACRQAATAQALAEEHWGEHLQEHIAADQTLAANPSSETARTAHDDSAALLVGARIEVIIAETETRNICG